VKYVALLNHDILSMIWKSYLNLVYLILQKPLMITKKKLLYVYVPSIAYNILNLKKLAI
jgi:hypothetical protein